MRILYTSDLHVDEVHYQRLLKLEEREKPHCLIIGGDLIPNKSGPNKNIDYQREFIKDFLIPYFSELKGSKQHLGIYILMGNYDKAANTDLFEKMEKDGAIHLLHKRLHVLEAQRYLVGYGYVPITPFALKDWERFDTREKVVAHVPVKSFFSSKEGMRQIDLKEELGKKKTIEEDMECISQMSDPRKTIYVMHSPPYNTALDRIFNGSSCGSKSIRNFIEKHEPYLTLHGHIHESPKVSGRFMEEIGKTVSINPGQEKGKLHAVVFDTENVQGTMDYFF